MQRRIGASGLVASSLLALACGAQPTAPRVVVAKPAPASPQPPAAWRIAHYPKAPRKADVVELAADGTQRLLIGGFRAEQRGKSVTFAEQSTADDIYLSCPAEKGYLHHTAGGRFFWSETFLGKLEPGGFIGPQAFGRLEQCGPVIVSERKGIRRLVHRHGVVTLPKNQLFRVGFLTPERGRAIDAPDRLLETRDGGGSFQELATRPAEAQDSPEAWLAGVRPPPRDSQGKDIQSPEAVEAWLRRAVASEVGRMMDGLRLSDGTWVRKSEDYHRIYLAFRMPSGQVTSYPLQGRCEVTPWGDKLLAECRDNVDSSLFSLTAAGIKPLPAAPVSPGFIVADPKGKLLAGRAWNHDDHNVRHDWLVRFDGQRWLVTPEKSWGPLALGGGRLLVSTGERQTGVMPFEQLAGPAIALPGALYSSYQTSNTGWFGDELYYLNGSYDGSELVWANLAEVPADVKSLKLPFATRQIAFADRLHGMAIDNQSRDWFTQDGGKSFARVSERQNWSSGVACWEHGCALDGELAWTNEPLPVDTALASPPATPAELAADDQTKPPEAPAADAPSPETYGPYGPSSPYEAPKTNAPLYVCQATPAIPKDIDDFWQRLLDVKKPENDAERPKVRRVNTLFGLVRRLGAGLAWNGHDAAGDFSVEAPALSGEWAKVVGDAAVPLVSRDLISEPPNLLPLLVRRGFVLVQTVGGEQNQLFAVKADGTTTLLFASENGYASLLPSPNGNVAVWMGTANRQELLWLDPSGGVLGRRWLIAPGALMLHDVAEPMTPHFAVPGPGGKGMQLLSLQRGSAAQPLKLNLQGPFAECTKPAAPNSRITLVSGFDGPRIELGRLKSQPLVYPTHWAAPSTAQGVVELSEHDEKAGCYRGVLMSDPVPLELHAAGPGRMTGTLIGPEGSHSVTCRRAPPPRNRP